MALIEKQPNSSDGLQIPGLVQSQEPVEQLSFTSDPVTPVPLPVPAQQSNAPELIGRYMTPRPISQAGIAETPMLQPASTGYSGGTRSLSGLEDVDTAHQPATRAEDTRTFQPASTGYSGGTRSLSGLEDVDTAHQPVAPAGAEGTQTVQPVATEHSSGSSSLAGFVDIETARQPISQAGLEGFVAASSGAANPATTRALQPFSQAGLASSDSASPATTRVLQPISQAGVTRTLEETRPAPNTTASRPPVVIRGSNQQNRARSMRPPQGRRHVISLAGILLLLVGITGMFIVASPLGQDVRATFGSLPGNTSVIQGTPNNMSLVAQATATAVVHQQNDGYDPTSNGGGPVATGGPRSWPFGVCTYWANLRYHELTGNWVTWTGNAYQWADGARLAGWHVSNSPHVPSIIVLMPGVEGASGYGHVAVVESANGDSVNTSNMNWYANGGGFGVESHYTFTAGSGVYFIWA